MHDDDPAQARFEEWYLSSRSALTGIAFLYVADRDEALDLLRRCSRAPGSAGTSFPLIRIETRGPASSSTTLSSVSGAFSASSAPEPGTSVLPTTRSSPSISTSPASFPACQPNTGERSSSVTSWTSVSMMSRKR